MSTGHPLFEVDQAAGPAVEAQREWWQERYRPGAGRRVDGQEDSFLSASRTLSRHY